MFRGSALGAALLFASSSLSLAQTAPAAPAAPTTGPLVGAAPGSDARMTNRMRRYEAIRAAGLTMGQALDAAERDGQGGRAISAEFERADGGRPARYEVKVVYPDGRLVEHEIDAGTGRVLGSENQPFERFFTRMKPADIAAAATSLRRAIELAEARVGNGARAIEAEIEREGGAVAYEIEVAAPDRTHEVRVAADGQVRLDD